MKMKCLEHRELCPFCHRIALKVCEYSEPYPRVEATCECCGYRSYDIPMELKRETFFQILDKLSRKEIGEICIDDRCGARDIIKLLHEGRYTEYRCLECGAEWNSDDMLKAIRRVKSVQQHVTNGSRLMDVLKADEGECPLCGWDIGHLHEGYAVEIRCPICGYHNEFKEELPKEEPPPEVCAQFEKSEEAG
ncbi:hypothetical protein BCF55_0462 [Hydrogenivirga caldilitoris]|uniref:Uncharacterized protein n=1 Tax=Hydrogenivirga caldilitoris TaxID=246264 RepID=A0A497XMN7_9AQUI|nr:hypothetical protein [Hydrogenivirga caldilitoris]RLJ70196.1 hypothetical protein BCF55_0462 [Hydrogenivirga caldilitoris]